MGPGGNPYLPFTLVGLPAESSFPKDWNIGLDDTILSGEADESKFDAVADRRTGTVSLHESRTLR